MAGLKTQDRGQLLMACGTGKTLTAFWIKQRLSAGRTLVLLPSLNLVAQTIKEWTEESSEDLNWIAVCSDETVAKKGSDEWVVNASDLGVPVTNNPQTIGNFLQQSSNGVVFSTYQSSPLVAEAQVDPAVPFFELALADEAHRCAGKVSESFGCILDGRKIRANKRLFMTATPRVLSERLRANTGSENIEVACMDDRSIFGDVLHRLSFSEAIEGDLLCDYKVVIIGVDDPMVHTNIQENVGITTASSQVINAEDYANHIALSKAIEDYSLRRVITFHSRIKGARDFAKYHPQITKNLECNSFNARELKTGFISGDMDLTKRSQAMDRLREIGDNEISILSNSRCLSEGVDVPTLDGIAFINPRNSQIDIIQSVGRAIRTAPNSGKSCGYIILPVYLGENGNLEQEIEYSNFRTIWQVLLALKSQDNQLSDALDEIRINKGKGTISDKSQEVLANKVQFDFPVSVSEKFVNSLKTMVVVNTTDSWKEKYGELIAFKEENGHILAKTDHPTLGAWISNNRVSYKNGTLSKERRKLLEKVGFAFDMDDYRWQTKFQELSAFKEKNGHLQVPKKHTMLGEWIITQRTAKREGKMPARRVHELTDIGFSFTRTNEDKWLIKYDLLLDYIKKNGHPNVLIKRDDPLSGWVTKQRKEFKQGTLLKEREALLNEVDFCWNYIDFVWNNFYQKLLIFSEKNGHSNPPRKDPELGRWVCFQRMMYVKGKLLPQRRDLLEQIDTWQWITRKKRNSN